MFIGALCVLATHGFAATFFTLSSPDLPEGAQVPERFTANAFGCHGGNMSPALIWSGAPPGTKSFAITLYDTYRPPQSGWWHWVVFDIPASVHGLKRGASSLAGLLPAGARQGLPDGDAPKPLYVGPCPDLGDPPHGYVFTIYALNVDHLQVPASATAGDIDYEAAAHAIGRAAFTRWHSR
jgi:Raf kinase inhibitor-like YbhB/YbcL family protein